MPETTPLIKAALNLRVGVGFDVYKSCVTFCDGAALMGERRKTLYYTYQLAKRKDLIL